MSSDPASGIPAPRFPLPANLSAHAASWVNTLTWLADEIHAELGPNPLGLRELLRELRDLMRQIEDQDDILQAIPDLATEVKDHWHFELINTAARLRRRVWEKLHQLSLPSPDAQPHRRIRTKSLRQITRACLRRRDKLCESFAVHHPESRVPESEEQGQVAIVRTDLARYTERVGYLIPAGKTFGDKAVLASVGTLDEVIRTQVQFSLGRLPLSDRGEVLASTGDGAVLRFRRVIDAIRFAGALHQQAREFSETTNLANPYQHRVGIAYGWVKAKRQSVRKRGGFVYTETAGVPLILAARMESSAPTGGVAIESGAWEQLQRELKTLGTSCPAGWPSGFGEEETLLAKHEEVYRGRLCPAPNALGLAEGFILPSRDPSTSG